MKTRGMHLLGIAALLALVGCGGGGGGGGNGPDASPDDFSFAPEQIDNAAAGETYTATATVTGFDGALSARITGSEGAAVFKLKPAEGEAADELSVSSGDVITLQATVNDDAQPDTAASATVTIGEGDDAKSASVTLAIVDATPPKLSATFPPAFSITSADAVTLTGYWWENSDGPVTLQLTRNGQQIDLPPHMMFADGTWQIDLPLDAGENVVGLTATDASGNTTEAVTLTIVSTDDVDAATAEQGLAFANPKELVIDAANDRLLAVSTKRVQGVSLANGHRGDYDLLQVPILRIGGSVLHEDDLWMSLHVDPALGTLPVVARMPLDSFGSGDAAPMQLSGDFLHFPELVKGSGLLVNEKFVLVGTQAADADADRGADAVYRIDRATNTIELVYEDEDAGGWRKHLQWVDANTFIHGDESNIELVNLADPENPVVKQVLNGTEVTGVKSYAYDNLRKRLYMVGSIEDGDGNEIRFGWADLSDLSNPKTAPIVEIVRTEAGIGGMPGYETEVAQLYGFALDEKYERLFALNGLQGPDEGREVVVINLMAVAVDEDGDSVYDTDDDGNPVRKQTGETVLLSRSGPRLLP